MNRSSAKSRRILEEVEKHPALTAEDIAEMVDTSPAYVRNVVRLDSVVKSVGGMLTCTEAAAYLSVHPNTLRRWGKSEVSYYTIGPRCDRRYRKQDLDAYLNRNRQRG